MTVEYTTVRRGIQAQAGEKHVAGVAVLLVKIEVELERADLRHAVRWDIAVLRDILLHDVVPHQVTIEGDEQRTLAREVVPRGDDGGGVQAQVGRGHERGVFGDGQRVGADHTADRAAFKKLPGLLVRRLLTNPANQQPPRPLQGPRRTRRQRQAIKNPAVSLSALLSLHFVLMGLRRRELVVNLRVELMQPLERAVEPGRRQRLMTREMSKPLAVRVVLRKGAERVNRTPIGQGINGPRHQHVPDAPAHAGEDAKGRGGHGKDSEVNASG